MTATARRPRAAASYYPPSTWAPRTEDNARDLVEWLTTTARIAKLLVLDDRHGHRQTYVVDAVDSRREVERLSRIGGPAGTAATIAYYVEDAEEGLISAARQSLIAEWVWRGMQEEDRHYQAVRDRAKAKAAAASAASATA